MECTGCAKVMGGGSRISRAQLPLVGGGGDLFGPILVIRNNSKNTKSTVAQKENSREKKGERKIGAASSLGGGLVQEGALVRTVRRQPGWAVTGTHPTDPLFLL